ncbi:hypothetical protein DSAG12_02665 [Promethearchaeum syntrophicum]|uniref:Uncharacterized protein n=1 Tax=Promethearchaeum syntrophicum TaxID=2594042 RepID=A0A5B9DCW8_9ARCH|nr:hypothetical protein [Candidatus Prometheoarchaeum syntrophicum]
MINKIQCIYCDKQSAIEIFMIGRSTSSSDGSHYYKCFNPGCSRFFTEIMRRSPKEKWEELLEKSNLISQAKRRECPHCCKNNAFEVVYPRNFDYYICECGKEFPDHDIKNIREDREIKEYDTNHLISIVENEFKEVNEEFREHSRQLNRHLNKTLILKVFHERLKRLENQ